MYVGCFNSSDWFSKTIYFISLVIDNNCVCKWSKMTVSIVYHKFKKKCLRCFKIEVVINICVQILETKLI